jgi:HK97 family phage prohead protease
MEHDNAREWFSASAEFKFAGAEMPVGEFTGYASTFGNIDLGGDIIERGAFLETLSRKSPKDVHMLLQHNARSYPIGDWLEMRENDQGLMVRGRLDLEDPDGARVYNAMKKGRLKGLSIGYFIPKGGADMDRNGTRRLKKISLEEISIVTVPMNPRAQANRVKDGLSVDITAEKFREIEAAIRESGVSRTDAVKAVSGLKKWLQREAEVPNTTPRDEVVAAELMDMIHRNIATLSS